MERTAAETGPDRNRTWRYLPAPGRLAVWAAAVVMGAATLTACGTSSTSSTSTPPPTSGGGSGTVLLVGTFHGHPGKYKTIQSAVDAATSGDWILVAPGDYHESADGSGAATHAAHGDMGGVLISTSNLHLRGMNRSTVIVDGTKPGAPGSCSAQPTAQNLGATGSDGKSVGRNGIVVWKANGVSVDNLTACNFLAGTGDSGNEIWWNGGADSGTIGLHGYSGSYLTATSTYYAGETSAAQYGIFAGNSAGPAVWNQLYASNFNDSAMYVGACLQVCGVTINHAWMEYSALGYSGTNSGGAVVVKNSQFDHNKDGFDTNTQINGDPPAPQNGACPGNGISPITHTHSCWVFMHNYVHDNNNPNVPQLGTASQGPTGTGMTLSGGRNDTVMDNTFAHNGAWGFLMVPYPDANPPELNQSCPGTGGVPTPGIGCVYDPMNNALLRNHFSNNGSFKNPSNGDYGQITLNGGQPSNCYVGNVAPDGSTPANLEQLQPVCGRTTAAGNTGGPLLAQVLCDAGNAACPANAVYPPTTGVVMHPLPKGLPTMPDPCAGVPSNPWCSNGKPV
jgi:hypothetical protein